LIRGLNKNCNHELKNLFKRAAIVAYQACIITAATALRTSRDDLEV
jgi:hypothetical protein